MIENSVIFISAYIIASVCNNIFFVLFIFSHTMKLLPFFRIHNFFDFFFNWFSDTICVDGSLFLQFLCHWMRIQVLPLSKSGIVFVHSPATTSSTSSFRNCFDMFFVFLKLLVIYWTDNLKTPKKYGVFRFPTFLESIIFWLFLQFICHWMRIQVLPSPKSVNEVVFCEFARSPEFLSIFPLTKRIKKTQFVWMEFSSDFGVTLFILVLFRLLLLISIVIFAN